MFATVNGVVGFIVSSVSKLRETSIVRTCSARTLVSLSNSLFFLRTRFTSISSIFDSFRATAISSNAPSMRFWNSTERSMAISYCFFWRSNAGATDKISASYLFSLISDCLRSSVSLFKSSSARERRLYSSVRLIGSSSPSAAPPPPPLGPAVIFNDVAPSERPAVDGSESLRIPSSASMYRRSASASFALTASTCCSYSPACSSKARLDACCMASSCSFHLVLVSFSASRASTLNDSTCLFISS
mmetsp:Transcript_36353/g.87773  ORF Transcript_36353/g.87773 Transcript_36353/m.87773 type:complete len:245 (+) Transcript_36353:5325-6059(+)